MLRFLCPSLLGLALLAQPAAAQTKPAARKAAPPKTRTATTTSAAARRTAPQAGTNDTGKGQSGYAAPGEPIQDPRYNGKNTPPYDGAAAPAKRNATLNTPK